MTEDREEAQDNGQDSPQKWTLSGLAGELPEELSEQVVNEYSHLDLEEQVLALLRDCTRLRRMLGRARNWPKGPRPS